jgi:hypothetical protein
VEVPRCPPYFLLVRGGRGVHRQRATGVPGRGDLGTGSGGATLLWAGDFAAPLAAVSEERWPRRAEGPPPDGHPVPRLPCPPCRGGWKMPVKKKRKSSGVAAAVAEDGGLKKCKISRYPPPPPQTLSVFPFGPRVCRCAWGRAGVAPRPSCVPGGGRKTHARLNCNLPLLLPTSAPSIASRLLSRPRSEGRTYERGHC